VVRPAHQSVTAASQQQTVRPVRSHPSPEERKTVSEWACDEIERLQKREEKLEVALGEALNMLRTISMFMLRYPEADTVAEKIRAWSELLK
jgi:hypothetical protein